MLILWGNDRRKLFSLVWIVSSISPRRKAFSHNDKISTIRLILIFSSSSLRGFLWPATVDNFHRCVGRKVAKNWFSLSLKLKLISTSAPIIVDHDHDWRYRQLSSIEFSRFFPCSIFLTTYGWAIKIHCEFYARDFFPAQSLYTLNGGPRKDDREEWKNNYVLNIFST